MRFDWDPDKDRENRSKHRLPLRAGELVFQDPNHLDDLDDRDYGEERWVAIGRVESFIIYVVYSDRGDVRRLISVRKATAAERARYESRWR